MSNSPAPAFNTQAARRPDGFIYQVLSQDGLQVVVYNNTCAPLAVGQVLEFEQGVKGVVTKTSLEAALVMLNELVNVTVAQAYSWLPFDTMQSVRFFADPALLGSMRVVCVGTKTAAPGYVGWSLYKDQNILVAAGNDLLEHNVCQMSGGSNWGLGLYRLEVRSFLPVTFQPIAYAAQTWELTTSQPELRAGNLNDSTEKLFLK